jgi:hypothetical protein
MEALWKFGAHVGHFMVFGHHMNVPKEGNFNLWGATMGHFMGASETNIWMCINYEPHYGPHNNNT